MKIIINKCYGGFGLSEDAVSMYLKRKGLQVYIKRHAKFNVYYTHPDMRHEDCFSEYGVRRDDPILISLIEEFGSASIGGRHTALEIVEIPDDVVHWSVHEAEGVEWIVEGRMWGALPRKVASSDPDFDIDS
jgi:hypothetical protein